MNIEAIISDINNFLKPAQRVAIIGVGMKLKGDDAVGIKVTEKLSADFNNSHKIAIFSTGIAPENWIGPISAFNPTHIIVVDAADFGEKPGTLRIIQSEEIGGFNFSTHGMSIGIFADYLFKNLGCSIIILGIQCKTLKFGDEMATEIKDASSRVVNILKTCLTTFNKTP